MKQSRQENLIYLIVWGLLFAAPLLSLYVRTVSDSGFVFDWSEVFLVWRKFAVFLLLFLIHNFLLAPLLIGGQKRWTYFAIVAVVVAAFSVYQCNSRPEPGTGPRGLKPPMGNAQFTMHNSHPHRGLDPRPRLDDAPPQFDEAPPRFDDAPPSPLRGGRAEGQRPPHELRHNGPPPIIGERDILAIVVLILMFGANLGIKGYFRGREDRRRLDELEHENLEQQLEYLRYQINPHFFMNTLNNIHALVDIEPEKAKDTILELSKMMRFVLYEGNKQCVPLSNEFDFIRHYIALMQLRYTEKVQIKLDLPQQVPNRQIPPLILITFIENAFKHGVSYQRESFISIKASVDKDCLLFSCRNSKAETSNQEKGGVGLANVRKRLNLLYGESYTLRIHNAEDVYSVELSLPLKS